MGWWNDRAVLAVIDGMAIVLGQAYRLARARLLDTGSAMLNLLIQRDHQVSEVELLRRELDVLRGQREGVAPHRRPDYSPQQRLAIIQLMRLREWSVKITAARFVLHENTVRAWLQAVEGKRPADRLLGVPRWNLIDDAVRWAVHELRRLLPEPEFGTRTIARHLVRAGIAISRRTVQRVIREDQPKRPRPGCPHRRAASGGVISIENPSTSRRDASHRGRRRALRTPQDPSRHRSCPCQPLISRRNHGNKLPRHYTCILLWYRRAWRLELLG